MIEHIKSDLIRYAGDTSFKSFIKTYIKQFGFRYMVTIRMCQAKGIIKYIGKFKYLLIRKDRIQIHPRTKIGYGLYIGHGGPIVINPTTTIGDNCNISQFVTIGSNNKKAAEIGNNVYIGPNCCLVENVKIGNNVTIGAGSVVTKDLPDNCTAAGNYAKVLNYKNPGKFVNNRWKK